MAQNGNYREFEGKTTEEAIAKAETTLKVPRIRMEIKIVCEEKKGLFGMPGAKLAKIKAAIKN